MPFETILLIGALFLVASVFASKASDKLGFPSLLLFLAIGMIAGSEGPGGLYFDNAYVAQSIGVVALVYILFYGGMDTDWKEIRPVLWQGISLATIGVLITSVLVAVFAMKVLGFSWLQGMLLGAIVSSTDAAAVFSILRSRGLSLKGRSKSIIELESGSNDPMAIFLTTSIVALMGSPESSVLTMAGAFFQQMTFGALLGYFGGRFLQFSLNRINLSYDGLYPVLSIAMVMLIYAVTARVGGNGFLAVYLAGLVAGNGRVTHKRSLTQFHDGIAWLMQIAMFVVLGLLVFPSQLAPVALTGLWVSVFLIVIARPVAVFLSLLPFQLSIRDRLFISWVGMRGAVPIILATFPMLANTPNSQIIFNMVFFVVLSSVMVQGTFMGHVSRLLKLEVPRPQSSRNPLEIDATSNLQNELITLDIGSTSQVVGKRVMDLTLPENTLIILSGAPQALAPATGRTVFKGGDRVVLLTKKSDIGALQTSFGASMVEADPRGQSHDCS
jgi:cell volume regulation protein A